MMSRARSVSVLLGAMLTTVATAAIALPSSFPTGTTYYDPERAYNGFVLFPGGDLKTHLIDMNGNEVHRWDYEGFPPIPLSADQADGEKGHLLVQLARAEKPPEHASPGNGLTNASVAEVNWDGEVKWQWGSQQDPVYQHHDMRRLPNGNTLIDEGQNGRLFQITSAGEIVWEYVSPFFGKSMPEDDYVTNQVYRAQLVDYDWAPDGTPHEETAVKPDCGRYPAAPGCHPGQPDAPSGT